MTGEKDKASKDLYQQALTAYGSAIKAFHKSDFKKAAELLEAFVVKYASEKELVDRAHIYSEICKNRLNTQPVLLKTFEDYFQYGVYQLNMGNVDDAVKHFQIALSKKPKAAKVNYLLANAYCLLEKDEECLDSLKTAVEADGSFRILAQNDNAFTKLRENSEFNSITKL